MSHGSNFYYLKFISVRYNVWCYLFFLLACNTIVSGVQNLGNVFKRQEYDDFRSCARNFEIHQDKIIRTEESKKMGAKYLNGKDVMSKDECVKFCCHTPNCNVFVLEEKVFNQQQGTCYLFECGSSDNFKCKFTRHHNYSSAVFIASRPQLLLEDEIQFTQHERELISLRQGENGTKAKNCHPSIKIGSAGDQQSAKINEPLQEPSKNVEETGDESFRKSSRCSRFQFECHSSGECIAIYNACDGIPQCADHSDEAAELGCPTNVIQVSPKKSIDDGGSVVERNTNENNALGRNTAIEDTILKPINAPYTNKNSVENPSANRVAQTVDQNLITRQHYSAPLKMNPWQSRMNQPFYRPSHNFNRKQNDMNIPYNYGEYGNIELNSLYDGYNGNNYNFNTNNNENKNTNTELKNNLYQSNVNSWHGKLGLIPELDPKNNEIFRNQGGPELYYEDNSVQHPNKVNEPYLSPENSQPKVYNNITIKLASPNHAPRSTEAVVVPAAIASTIASVTIAALSSSVSSTFTKVNSSATSQKSIVHTGKQSGLINSASSVTSKVGEQHPGDFNASQVEEKVNSEHNAHRKLEKQLTVELSPAQEKLFYSKSGDNGYTQHPSGAFVSLSLGVCLTAIMIFVVAYRLKIVRKRIRRGKLPYAHDADFLVNGMYL